jgi:hypothetical protein
VVRVGHSDIFSDNYLVTDAYDFLQMSDNVRIQMVNLILFVLSALGISAGTIATIFSICCRSKLSKNKKLFLDTVVARQNARSRKQKTTSGTVAINIPSLFASSGSGTGAIPKRRALIPGQRAISHKIHVGETNVNEIRPTALPLLALNKPTTIQEITELVSLIHSGEQNKPKQQLPVQNLLAKSKEKGKVKPKPEPKRSILLWMAV